MDEIVQEKIKINGIYGMSMSKVTFIVKTFDKTGVVFTNGTYVTIAAFNEYYFFIEMLDTSKVKVGDYFDDGTVSRIIRIEGNKAYYDEINSVPLDYAYHQRTSMKEETPIVPTHYNSTAITALQVIDDWKLNFYLGNVVKYIARNELKGNQLQDLKKASQYLDLYIKKLEKE